MVARALLPAVALAAAFAFPAAAWGAAWPELLPQPAPVPQVTAVPTASPGPAPEPTAAPTVRPETTRPRALPTGRTLTSAIRRAHLAGHIDRAAWRRHVAAVTQARRVLRRARGTGRAELAAVLGTAGRLAADERLSASRLAQVLLTVRRNAALVRRGALPAPGERMSFGRDPLVFQRFAGQGVQVHPLATAGRANALAKPCLRRRRGLDRLAARQARTRLDRQTRPAPLPRLRDHGCRARALRDVLDRLAAIASGRDGGLAWEYVFAFGGSSAPWVSGMAQATAAQAFARGAVALAEPGYAAVAERALHAFDRPPPFGVRTGAPGGLRYALYSGRPSLDVLNASLQAVIGLHEVERRLGSRRAARMWRAAEPAARAAVGASDTGAWSLYSRGGREATLGYHRLVTRFLGRLCGRLDAATYCRAATRFRSYTRRPTRVSLSAAAARAQSPSVLRIALDRGASVVVRTTGRPARRLRLERGVHRIAWLPVRAGRARISVAVRGPEGRTAHTATRVQVRTSWRVLRERAQRRAARERAQRRAARERAQRIRRERAELRDARRRDGRRRGAFVSG